MKDCQLSVVSCPSHVAARARSWKENGEVKKHAQRTTDN